MHSRNRLDGSCQPGGQFAWKDPPCEGLSPTTQPGQEEASRPGLRSILCPRLLEAVRWVSVPCSGGCLPEIFPEEELTDPGVPAPSVHVPSTNEHC